MGIVDQLKRRKVVRAVIVYTAAAFAILQAADLLAAGLAFPPWVFPAITIALILGFPLAIVFTWAFELTPSGLRRTTAEETGISRERWFSRRSLIALGAIVLITALGAWVARPLVKGTVDRRALNAARDRDVTFASIIPPEGEEWEASGAAFAVSPNGRHLAVVTSEKGTPPELAIRSLNGLRTERLTGTRGAAYPFWSPDSRSVGFFADGQLKIIDIRSSSVQSLCPAALPRGGSWGSDGVILFVPEQRGSLHITSVAEGKCEALPLEGDMVPPDRAVMRAPYFLPNGRDFIVGAADIAWLGNVHNREVVLLRSNTRGTPVIAPPDYVLFTPSVGDPSLYAQRLDLRARKLVGEPRRILDRVTTPIGRTAVSVSANGVLVAHGPGLNNSDWRARWLTREGLLSDSMMINAPGWSFRVGRTRKQVAIGGWGLSLHDVKRNTTSAVWSTTAQRAAILTPVWSPDDTLIAFVHAPTQAEAVSVFLFDVRTGTTRSLYRTFRSEVTTTDWSPDGRYLAFTVGPGNDAERTEAWIYDFRAGTARKLFADIGDVAHVRFSPDGGWLAYQSNAGGSDQVHVRPFLRAGPSAVVSTQGGRFPRWRDDGAELFYVGADGSIVAAPVTAQDDVAIGAPVVVAPAARFAATAFNDFEVTDNGQRFLLFSRRASQGFTLVLDWWKLLTP